MCCELAIVFIVRSVTCDSLWQRKKMCYTCLLGNQKQRINSHGIRNSIFPSSLFIYFKSTLVVLIQILIWGNLHHTNCIHLWLLKHQNFGVIDSHMISNVWTSRWPLGNNISKRVIFFSYPPNNDQVIPRRNILRSTSRETR